jgi:polygalacturonase
MSSRLPAVAPFVSLLLCLVAAALPGRAQDTRTVVEPTIPSACVQLEARLSVSQGKLTEAEEQSPDTARLQHAIDQCRGGQAVELRASGAKNIFLTGPIQLRSGVTLLIDAGTALFGSSNPRDYDLSPGSCGTVSEHGHGCRPLILAKDAPGAGIMGDGVIDGRGGVPLAGEKETWWDLAHIAKVKDLSQSCPRILVVQHSNGFTMYRITLRNSPNFHVSLERTDGFTAWGVHIDAPGSARNTDGIDPSSSTNVTITRSYIRVGDDNIAIKAGFAGRSTHMTISDDHFYSGHGMSIGSETNGGVSDILVRNLTIDGADNGIRIKSDRSRGGLVQHVVYEKVCMRDVKNPIVMTPHYASRSGNLIPEYRDILLRNIHILTAGRYTLEGQDAQHPLAVQFDNVSVDDRMGSDVTAAFANFTLGPGLGNFAPQYGDVAVTKLPGSKPIEPVSCDGVFPPYPPLAGAPDSAENVPVKDVALYVSKDSTAEYRTVQSAIDAAPAEGATIRIAPGVYRETIRIDKPNMRLVGSDPDPEKTVIVFDKSAGDSGGTLHSATVNVRGDDFFAANLTLANDWNRTHAQSAQGSQALALLVTGDRAIFSNVRLLGNQDTLYAGNADCSPDTAPCTATHQFFSGCYIEGNVDFIFGDGNAYFRDCEIHSTAHKGGYITAQSKHYPGENSAFVFDRCRLTAEPAAGDVWLGRPWRPYATVVFLHTRMGNHIVPAGWREWHPGETHSLDTAFYAEFDSTGPGAQPGQRDPHTHRLDAAQAQRFSLRNFFPAWDAEADLRRLQAATAVVPPGSRSRLHHNRFRRLLFF